MLTVYRRHKGKCEFATAPVTERIEKFIEERPTPKQLKNFVEDLRNQAKRCHCALWITGTLEGKLIRESLHTRNLDRAEQLKRQRELGVTPPVPPSAIITVDHAAKKYYESCEERQLSANTLKKYRTLRDVIVKFAVDNRIVGIKDFGTDLVRAFVKERGLAALTAGKRSSACGPSSASARKTSGLPRTRRGS